MLQRIEGLNVIEHPLIECYLSKLRDCNMGTIDFRRILKKIALLMSYPISQYLSTVNIQVQTPYGKAQGSRLARPIAIFPIMRSGMMMSTVIEEILEVDLVSPLGIRRNRETLMPQCYYTNMPEDLSKYDCFIIDPMLATGKIMCSAVEFLKNRNANMIALVSLIATPEGIRYIQSKMDVPIFCCKVDDGLNSKGYIVPGLGDIGDRAFGGLDNALIIN